MIVRIKKDGDTLTPAICDDAGTELWALEPRTLQLGDVLDVLLPGLDPASLIRMT